jgi:hypothetical protein
VAEQRTLPRGGESATWESSSRLTSFGGSLDLEGAARGLSHRRTKERLPSHIGESGLVRHESHAHLNREGRFPDLIETVGPSVDRRHKIQSIGTPVFGVSKGKRFGVANPRYMKSRG